MQYQIKVALLCCAKAKRRIYARTLPNSLRKNSVFLSWNTCEFSSLIFAYFYLQFDLKHIFIPKKFITLPLRMSEWNLELIHSRAFSILNNRNIQNWSRFCNKRATIKAWVICGIFGVSSAFTDQTYSFSDLTTFFFGAVLNPSSYHSSFFGGRGVERTSLGKNFFPPKFYQYAHKIFWTWTW